MKENSTLTDFFYGFSKIVFYIPLIIVVLAVILYKTTPAPTIVPTISKKPTKQVQLNLTGPFVCESSIDGATVSAYIKNKQLFAQKSENKTDKFYLFSGDCFYSWDQTSYQGIKVCGLKSYVGLLTSVPGLNPINIIETMTGKSQTDKWKKLVESCIEKEFSNQLFSLPKNIVFQPKKMPRLRPTFPSSALE